MVPKEKDASRISQFMTKSLLSVEGKIFFAVMEKYDQPLQLQRGEFPDFQDA